MSEKIKRPLVELETIALAVYEKLKPYCVRIKIAGSIRRRENLVSDIELVLIPHEKEEQEGLFGTPVRKRIAAFSRTINDLGTVSMGKPETGRYVKLMLPEGVQVDIFITNESDYGRQLAIRTGNADYSFKVLAYGWTKHGWVGTEDGLRMKDECEKRPGDVWQCTAKNPTLPPRFTTEQDFFTFIGVKYIEPHERFIKNTQ